MKSIECCRFSHIELNSAFQMRIGFLSFKENHNNPGIDQKFAAAGEPRNPPSGVNLFCTYG